MNSFVLDNSVAMRWLLQSTKAVDQNYAESVLLSLAETNALVPNLWHLEAANVLLAAEKRHEINPGDMERFIDQLESLPILVDAMTSLKVFNRTLALAKALRLSSYDAAYLELAVREGLPLASLDRNLRRATRNTGVDLYLK